MKKSVKTAASNNVNTFAKLQAVQLSKQDLKKIKGGEGDVIVEEGIII